MESRGSFKLNRRIVAIIVALAIVLTIGSVVMALGGIFGFSSATTVSAFTGYRLPFWNWAEVQSRDNLWISGSRVVSRSGHDGQIDFDIAGNSVAGDILAAKPGKVVFVKDNQSLNQHNDDWEYANMVVIEHGPSEYSWYVHLAPNSVPDNITVGAYVGYGTKIGIEGRTGTSNNVTHLHFMVSTGTTKAFDSTPAADEAPWASGIVRVNFFERSWNDLDVTSPYASYTSLNGAAGSCNGYDSPGVSLFKHKDCVGPAAIEYTIGKHTMYEYPDWEQPGTSLNDKISSISVRPPKDGQPAWFLQVFKDNNGLQGLGPNRTLDGNSVYDRNKWDLSSDWYTNSSVNMNDSISFFECGVCGGAGALSVASADGTSATCPEATPPASTPPPQPTPEPTQPPPPTPEPQPSASWNVKFYSSVDECSGANCNPGSVYHQRSVSGESLDISFSDGRAYGTGTDHWGSIWTQTINFPSGSYVFHADHDDGVKLFINGVNIMDVGGAENNNQTCPARNLSGSMPVTVIWKNTGGSARLKLWWDTNASACASPIPAAPSNLRQTGSTLNSVSLAWNDNSGNESGFRIYRWNGSAFVQFAWLGANVTSWTDTSNVCGTGYFYKVAAYNADGESSHSNMVQANSQTCPSWPPNNPSNLRVNDVSDDGIGLAWNDNSTNEEGFRIYWWNGTATELFTTVGPNTTYLWIDRPCGWTGSFYVSAFNQYNNGDFTLVGPVTATTWNCWVNMPSNLRVNWVTERSVNLSWDDNSNNEAGFRLYRWNGTTMQWEVKATLGANVTTYDDSPVNSSTGYFYQVTSIGGGYESPPTPWVLATTHPQVPLIARNLRMTYSAKTYLAIEWDDMSNNEDGFEIAHLNPDWTFDRVVGTIGPNATSFIDYGLTCGTGYLISVRSFNVTGGYYQTIEAWTSPCDAPNPPASFYQSGATANSISLAWNDRSGDETGFRVKRWNGYISDWEVIASLGANVTTFTDNNVVCEQGYAYYVDAYNATGQAGSEMLEAYSGSCIPEAPSNLHQVGSTQNSITISWNDNSPNEDVFNIWRWDGVAMKWEWWDHVNANTTTYTDANLNCGYGYFYQVTAYNNAGESMPADWISATTMNCGKLYQVFLPAVQKSP